MSSFSFFKYNLFRILFRLLLGGLIGLFRFATKVEYSFDAIPYVLSKLRGEFWILNGRRCVQKVLHKCICKKVQGNFYSVPPSPPLPEFRVVQSRPFRGTGLDYLGHFWVKDGTGPRYKAWYIQFTCGSTRAVHLEAVKSKTQKIFLMQFHGS